MTTSSFRLSSFLVSRLTIYDVLLFSILFEIWLLKYSLFFYSAPLERRKKTEKIMYPFSFDFHTLACFSDFSPVCISIPPRQIMRTTSAHFSVSSFLFESTRIVHIIRRTEYCCVVSEKFWLQGAFAVMDSLCQSRAEGKFDEIDIFAVAISEVSRKSECSDVW